MQQLNLFKSQYINLTNDKTFILIIIILINEMKWITILFVQNLSFPQILCLNIIIITSTNIVSSFKLKYRFKKEKYGFIK